MTLAEAKQTLRLSQSDTTHDADIADAIDAATEQLEQDCDRVVITQVFRWTSDSFPTNGGPVSLAQKPVQSIESITYLDSQGDLQTLDAAAYKLNEGNRQVYLAAGQSWPTVQGGQESVIVEYKAGYGDDASFVPRLIKRAILLQVGKWFYDPAMEMGLSGEAYDVAYQRIVQRLLRTTYP